jgi:hypothetical protein
MAVEHTSIRDENPETLYKHKILQHGGDKTDGGRTNEWLATRRSMECVITLWRCEVTRRPCLSVRLKPVAEIRTGKPVNFTSNR